VAVYRLTRLDPAAARSLTVGELRAWIAAESGDGPGPHTATLDELRG
jgi:hypothetical protein